MLKSAYKIYMLTEDFHVSVKRFKCPVMVYNVYEVQRCMKKINLKYTSMRALTRRVLRQINNLIIFEQFLFVKLGVVLVLYLVWEYYSLDIALWLYWCRDVPCVVGYTARQSRQIRFGHTDSKSSRISSERSTVPTEELSHQCPRERSCQQHHTNRGHEQTSRQGENIQTARSKPNTPK